MIGASNQNNLEITGRDHWIWSSMWVCIKLCVFTRWVTLNKLQSSWATQFSHLRNRARHLRAETRERF